MSGPATVPARRDVLADLEEAVGEGAVTSVPNEIVRVLKDNSWLSPVLSEKFEQRRKVEGPTLGVVAVVSPRAEADVIRAVKVAVEHSLAITPRGSGTSNFGLVTPERGGLIMDLRRLVCEPRIEADSIRASAGTVQGAMELAARQEGLELPVLTTTYASATVGGWVAGGHVGLGSGVFGAVWDDIVPEVRIVTAEENPRSLPLVGEDALPVLHTFGSAGIVTDVSLRLTDAREWLEAVAFFGQFEQASDFVRELSLDERFRQRVITAQEELLMPAFRPLEPIMKPGAGVLMIVDKAQVGKARLVAESLDGSFAEWQLWRPKGSERTSIGAMVYGHRMLYVKRLFPEAAFLHLYFDPGDPDADVRALKDRFGDEVLVEMKYIRSPWLLRVVGHDPAGTLPAAVVTIRRGSEPGAVDRVLDFCEQVGIRYQNPHTEVIEDSGLFPDVGWLVRHKSHIDPFNLLNPGKLRSAVSVRP